MPNFRSLILLSSLIAAMAVNHGCATPDRDLGSVTIDPSVKYQMMTGWEVTARVWEYNKSEDKYDGSWIAHRDQLLQMLVDDVGINRLRIEVRSGAENPVDYWAQFEAGEIGYKALREHFYEKINDNDDPFLADPNGFQFSHLDYQVENILLPLQALLDARGERLKVNLCFVDFRWTKLKGNFELALDADEYSELILAAHQHLEEKYGLKPDYFEIILEPDNSDRWGGYQIGQAIVAVKKRLGESGFTPELIAPSTAIAGASLRYFRDIEKVEGAAEALSSYAYHRYEGRGSRNHLEAIRDLAQSHQLRTEMLEYTEGTYEYLYEDLTMSNASAWQLFMVARKIRNSHPTSSVWIDADIRNSDRPKYRLSERGRLLAPFMRDVRYGATRIDAASSNSAVEAVAFTNADGRSVVILKTGRAGNVTLNGMPAGQYTAVLTHQRKGQDNLGEFTIADGAGLSLDVPGAGIVALVAQ